MNSQVSNQAGSEVMRLRSATLIDGQVEVNWSPIAPPARFSPFWLRDHCRAAHSLNADTLQREVDTFSIPRDIAPAKLEIRDGGGALNVVWQHDASTSVFPA